MKNNWYGQKRKPQQRRTIYRFLRMLGISPEVAGEMRSWRLQKILVNIESRRKADMLKYDNGKEHLKVNNNDKKQ